MKNDYAVYHARRLHALGADLDTKGVRNGIE